MLLMKGLWTPGTVRLYNGSPINEEFDGLIEVDLTPLDEKLSLLLELTIESFMPTKLGAFEPEFDWLNMFEAGFLIPGVGAGASLNRAAEGVALNCEAVLITTLSDGPASLLRISLFVRPSSNN
mmetsp:Transcript_19507/g.28336  ORF Transcript_19507/g.28336 Transcript_19507/m.28336 type:complete len:124 (-) Transcript_19507:156-527(-)